MTINICSVERLGVHKMYCDYRILRCPASLINACDSQGAATGLRDHLAARDCVLILTRTRTP